MSAADFLRGAPCCHHPCVPPAQHLAHLKESRNTEPKMSLRKTSLVRPNRNRNRVKSLFAISTCSLGKLVAVDKEIGKMTNQETEAFRAFFG